MQTELLITDVTQMGEKRICVAGVTHKNQSVRLLLRSGNLQEFHLQLADQNIMRPRAVIDADLEPHEKCEPPHVEDHYWVKPGQSILLRSLDDQAWRKALQRICSPCLDEVFGVTLEHKRKAEPGYGRSSLGTIRLTEVTALSVAPDPYGKHDGFAIRIDFVDSSGESITRMPVTDLTLNKYVKMQLDQGTRMEHLGKDLSKRLVNAREIYLRVGLTRPHQFSHERQSWSYVQVNGVHSFPDLLEGESLHTLWRRTSSLPSPRIARDTPPPDDLPF